MVSAWIPISTRWEFSSVQAALNVIISVFGTAGIWAFSRFWWQRGSKRILRTRDDIPLSKTFAVSSLGESCDLVKTLGRKIYVKENWGLLVQILVIAGITIICALAGPISKASLKKGLRVVKKEAHVLPVVKGDGPTGNLLDANVLWNRTMKNLNDAGFPTTQLLDFLPPASDPPWVYRPNEWDPTWKVDCDFTDDVEIPNMAATGNYTIHDPINSFPAFRDTFDPMWLDDSEFRQENNYLGWEDWKAEKETDGIFFTVIQSDPAKNNRMNFNNETLKICFTALHAKDVKIKHESENGSQGALIWFPYGEVGSATYMRAECAIRRRREEANEGAGASVLDSDKIPWVWTNDTGAVIETYADNFGLEFFREASKGGHVRTPTARELFRLYQVYMVTMNTFNSREQVKRPLSSQVWTVELSVVSLAVLIVVFLLTACTSMRYFVFLRRNRSGLRECYVPDGKMGWMIHAVKCSDPESCMVATAASADDAVSGLGPTAVAREMPLSKKDSDHFCSAMFGPSDEKAASSEGDDGVGGRSNLRSPGIARVKTSRTPSVSVAESRRGSSPAVL